MHVLNVLRWTSLLNEDGNVFMGAVNEDYGNCRVINFCEVYVMSFVSILQIAEYNARIWKKEHQTWHSQK